MVAIVPGDISVDRTTGDIRWNGATTTYHTVLELHRFLQDLADDAASAGNDELDITDVNPSVRRTDQIIELQGLFNVDDTTAEQFFGGSVRQGTGGTEVLYAGLRVIGSVNNAATELQIVQNNGLITSWWGTGINDADAGVLLRTMIKVRDAGADIDGGRIRVQAREFGDSYAFFNVSLVEGESVAAISTISDTNNQTALGTIQALVDVIDQDPGFNQIDLNNGAGLRDYYSEWDRGANSINTLYEFAKSIQVRASAVSLHGINGQLFQGITHSVPYDTESGGPFTEDEILTFSNGATGLLLALGDDGATGILHIQLLTGVAPVDNDTMTGGTSSATATVNGAPTERTVNPVFLGNSTGAAISGAFGVGVESADLTASDSLIDLAGVLQTPPNNQTIVVGNLVIGEDYVLVAPADAGLPDFDQFTANGVQGAGGGTLTVNGAIPADGIPASGILRIETVTDNGSFDRVPYTSFSGSVFTLTGTLPNAVADAAEVFVPFIDELATATSASAAAVYTGDIPLVIRVRDGGTVGSTPIVPFEATGTFGSGGFSINAIRQSDA